VYYSHFTDVYRKTLSRVASGEGEAPARSIVAPPSVKAQRWITGKTDDYGLPSLPVLAIVAAGAVMLGRQRRREGFTLVLAGWAIVWAGFSALGIFSPLAMRVNLAAAPVFTCLAAYALGGLAARSRLGTALAVIGALIVGWDGFRVCLIAIGLTPPW
jgi:4-amino-4-deoxy-L-arabinose transferase-like glycosyltransferase